MCCLKRETLNREYAYLVADLFRRSEMFVESEEETKVIGKFPVLILGSVGLIL